MAFGDLRPDYLLRFCFAQVPARGLPGTKTYSRASEMRVAGTGGLHSTGVNGLGVADSAKR